MDLLDRMDKTLNLYSLEAVCGICRLRMFRTRTRGAAGRTVECEVVWNDTACLGHLAQHTPRQLADHIGRLEEHLRRLHDPHQPGPLPHTPRHLAARTLHLEARLGVLATHHGQLSANATALLNGIDATARRLHAHLR